MNYEDIYNNGVSYLSTIWNICLLFLESSNCMYAPYYLVYYNLFVTVINNDEFALNIDPDLIRRYYSALLKTRIIAVSEEEAKQIREIKQGLCDVFGEFQSYNGTSRQ